MPTTNDALRSVRRSMLMTQEGLAQKLREVTGTDDINTRTIQRWEAGTTSAPRALHARALQMVTGLPLERLGFPSAAERVLLEDGRGGYDLGVRATDVTTGSRPPHGNYSGIWISRYEYFSSGRDAAFEGQHAVMLTQIGTTISVHSIFGSAQSSMSMTLDLDGAVATGTWMEMTEQGGYYQGARYHGSIQLIVGPTGRRMTGKWVGFGKDGDVNTGPWTLTFKEASTSSEMISRYSAPLSGHSG
jgi:hypothetical protein